MAKQMSIYFYWLKALNQDYLYKCQDCNFMQAVKQSKIHANFV